MTCDDFVDGLFEADFVNGFELIANGKDGGLGLEMGMMVWG